MLDLMKKREAERQSVTERHRSRGTTRGSTIYRWSNKKAWRGDRERREEER